MRDARQPRVFDDPESSREKAGGCVLRPHPAGCFVCGPDNPAATGIVLHTDADRVVGEVRLDDRHQGVPGVAHGGAIAAIVDEVAGSVMLIRGERFVTANLTIDFRAPVIIGQLLTTIAWLESRDGRKHFVAVELSVDDMAVGTAQALFVTVPEAHFSSLGTQQGAALLFGC